MFSGLENHILEIKQPHTVYQGFPKQWNPSFCKDKWNESDSPSEYENPVIIYSPSCRSKPVWLFILWKKKDDILKYVGNQTVSVPTGFHCIFCPYNWSRWQPKWFGYHHFSKHSFFYHFLQKSLVWNDMRVNKLQQNLWALKVNLNENIFRFSCLG